MRAIWQIPNYPQTFSPGDANVFYSRNNLLPYLTSAVTSAILIKKSILNGCRLFSKLLKKNLAVLYEVVLAM
jgi:hypothetical protein